MKYWIKTSKQNSKLLSICLLQERLDVLCFQLIQKCFLHIMLWNVSSFTGGFYKPSCKIQTNIGMRYELIDRAYLSLLLYLSYIKHQ